MDEYYLNQREKAFESEIDVRERETDRDRQKDEGGEDNVSQTDDVMREGRFGHR